jgi:hypothetical protein
MAPGKSLMRIEPCPIVKNSSLFAIGSNTSGLIYINVIEDVVSIIFKGVAYIN